ncbi:MAG: hypothetical protein IJ222_03390 [Bacteroidales bacterium]|nr:hypothetical protein [Bacteroidales bacterium]
MLFNKNNNGSEELHALTGVFQAGAKFSAVRPELLQAGHEVSAIVGKEVIAAAQEIYDADNAADAELEFVDAVRRPVAYLAVLMFSKANTVVHGEQGRKMKTDENEKTPFAWMLDRDDRELRERYYGALDALLLYLKENKPDLYAGMSSRAKLDGSIVRDLADLEAVYPVEHSYYMLYRLTPMFLEMQDTRLRAIIGEDNLSALLAGESAISASMISNSRKFVILTGLSTAVRRWGIDIFPLAIARRFAPSYQGNQESRAATLNEIDWFLNQLLADIDETKKALLDEVNGSDGVPAVKLIPDNDPRNKYFTV